MKKVKIFEIIPSLGIGGGEKVAIEIANNLDKNMFDVTLISLYSNDEFVFDKRKIKDVKIITLDKKKGLDIKIIFKLIKLFKKEKPDVVHTHMYVAPYVVLPSILGRVKKRIHTIHSVANKELGNKKRKIMYFLYHYFGFVPVAISPFVKKTIEKEYHINENEIPCIYNGVDRNKFKKKYIQKDNSKIRLISVARFSTVKNHILMLKAFSLAAKKDIRLELYLVGDGPEKEQIKKEIKLLNIEDKVKLVGMVEDVQKELEDSDIFIMTSLYEGLPISVLEAMNMGLPIITTPAGGVIDIVENGVNGIIANYDEKEISKAILEISLNDKKRKDYSTNSLNLSKKYDITRMTKDYERLFKG